jgi:hypothetical protein
MHIYERSVHITFPTHPRPKAPRNEIDIYMQSLIKDLQELWGEGISTYDTTIKKIFQMRATVRWTINDFPAYVNLSGWSTKEKFVCSVCNIDIGSDTLKFGKKTCYITHHQFLLKDHPWHRQMKEFDDKVELKRLPNKLSGGELKV